MQKPSVPSSQTTNPLTTFKTFLDRCHDLLNTNDQSAIEQAVQRLIERLGALKFGKDRALWQATKKIASEHPLVDILGESLQIQHLPWPRGYRGDAEMLDLIYGLGERNAKLAQATVRGRWLEEYFSAASIQATARLRLHRISQLIDDICRQQEQPHILSIACGQLREGGLCKAIREKQFGRFVAHDQDPKSIEVVRNDFGQYGVEIVSDSLGAIFKKRIEGSFDFIYAAGLYDYLPDETAAQLTLALFNMLNPGGRFITANYTTDTLEAGFMEAFLDWPMIYRTLDEIHQFYSLIPQEDITSTRVFPEAVVHNRQCLYYLELIKKTKRI